MSSRQEEKERRKRERQEAEQAAQAGTARRKRMQMVFGGVIALIAVVAVVVLVAGVFGGSDPEVEVAKGDAAIPAKKESDLKKAAAAAGCKLVDPPGEGAGHEEKTFKASDYKSNPPTSGTHFPTWYDDGVYAAGDTPELGRLVHTLEHGRIDVQYKPGTDAKTIAQLETLVNESDGGYHMLLFENQTKMPYAVAASAWEHYIGCPTMNPQVFDAFRAFRLAHIDKGPEIVP
jgi:uncharacterized protein DUF3105